MADLFQEVFNPTNTEVAMLPLRSTGYNPELLPILSEIAIKMSMEFSLFFILLCGRAGYHGRMQQIMQMEKDRHAEFLRQFNIEQGCLGGATLVVMKLETYMILLVIAVGTTCMFSNSFICLYTCISEVLTVHLCRWFKGNYCSDFVKVVGRKANSLLLLVPGKEQCMSSILQKLLSSLFNLVLRQKCF